MTTEKNISLLCRCEQEAGHPITVPFVRLDENTVIFEGRAIVHCFYEAGLKLSVPAELPGWKVEKQEAGNIELRGESLNPLLVLDRVEDAAEATRQRIKNIVTRVEQESASFVVEQETEFGELRQTTLRLNVVTNRAAMTLLGWKLDDRAMPDSQLQWNENNGSTTLSFVLPPEKLFSPVKMTVALRLRREGMSYFSQLPALHWNDASLQEIIPVSWRIKSDPAAWLWWASERTEESRHSNDGWLPTTPERTTGSTSETAFDLQGLSSSASLRWLAIPRSLSVLGLSGLALILMRVLSRRPVWAQRLALLFLGLLLILFVLSPGLAAVLFWGAMPGVLIGLGLPWLMKQRLREPRRVPVFQTTGIVSSTSLHSLKPAGSTTEAPTIITSSPQRLR